MPPVLTLLICIVGLHDAPYQGMANNVAAIEMDERYIVHVAENPFDVGETTPDGKFSLTSLRCVGACGLAPVVLIGEKVYGRVTPGEVEKILKEFE